MTEATFTAYDLAPEDVWVKSSYSDPGQNCVEIADLASSVAVRDSKVPAGPAFRIGAAAFAAFVQYAKA
ncbi:DUF397 domain-containing protein [Streptomyces sp. WM6378]|uniref:DUF397 domain-containing protein n=1 Tax=Streptomyces sp. WM6378 TaxID=1415557 RepID=UPI0006B01974|nr:DUF397 domain-containing protein [Streptomyces sp. WM6378]KOU53982.1 hypothetical protein ADK54_02765 [Streptomyces sp. WM6378]